MARIMKEVKMPESHKADLRGNPPIAQAMPSSGLDAGGPAALECRDFSFFYGAAQVLDKINFRLERGGWLSILGGNGSGKSTLLKNTLRLVRGRSLGEIRITDRPLDQYSQRELARILAYVPQAGGRVPPFTVREFLNLSRYPFGLHSNAHREKNCESVEAALELCAVRHLAERRMDQLSGGQRQRAYLAAAIAQDADILLLDEPASFLDPRHVFAMNELLKMLHRERHYTIITVTHDLSHPLDAGGYALVLREGKQVHFGPAEDLAGKGILEEAFGHEFSYLTHPKSGKTVVVA